MSGGTEPSFAGTCEMTRAALRKIPTFHGSRHHLSNQCMKNQILLLCMLLSIRAFSQAPVSETIHVNSVEAKVWSNGSLFGWNIERSFKVPKSNNNDSVTLTTFRRVAPWIGSVSDHFGHYIHMAGGDATGTKIDFKPGLIEIEGFNQIWKVTKSQILAHRADFADNDTIDNPIDAVMNWPGTILWPEFDGNVLTQMAPFSDVNGNGIYEPISGDFPFPCIGDGYTLPGIPDELLFFPFHDVTDHPVSHASPLSMQVFCTAWAYSCPEEPAFNNSIFVSMEYRSRFTYVLDSMYTGLLFFFDIGKAKDDYIGSLPDEDIVYAYNGDPIDENGFEDDPPVIGIFRVGTNEVQPLNQWLPFEPATHFTRIHVYNEENLPDEAYVTYPEDYYQRLQGLWPDGTPLRPGGYGYHPQDTATAVNFAYPGFPGDPTGWSEASAGIIPGPRRAMVSYNYPDMEWNSRQRSNYCFTWARHPDSVYAIPWALEQFKIRKNLINGLCQNKPSESIPVPPCLFNNTSSIPIVSINTFTISPNPTSNVVRINMLHENMQSITLTDLSGKILYQQQNIHTSELDLDLPLPAGLYFLTVITDDNKRLTQKLVISH